MYLVLMIVVIIICVLLGAIVLIQNPKGGGLTSNFSSSSQLMGVQKTGDFLEKGTWILAIGLMVLSLLISVMGKTGGTTSAVPGASSDVMKKINGASGAPASNATPVTIPAATGKKSK
jgi:preprotein translocase subunit SecG